MRIVIIAEARQSSPTACLLEAGGHEVLRLEGPDPDALAQHAADILMVDARLPWASLAPLLRGTPGEGPVRLLVSRTETTVFRGWSALGTPCWDRPAALASLVERLLAGDEGLLRRR